MLTKSKKYKDTEVESAMLKFSMNLKIKNFNKQMKAKEAEDAAPKSQHKLESEIYKDKMQYKEFLIDLVEKKVRLRRQRGRKKKIQQIRGDKDKEKEKKIPCEKKKYKVEKQIEEIISYFTNENNLRNPSRELKLIVK